MTRYRDWFMLLPIVGFGILTANFVGYGGAFLESLPGVAIILAITIAAVAANKLIPLRLPIVAYCSLLGMALACPLSPVAPYVIGAVSKIDFAAPLTIVGAFAGISIGTEVKTFAKQGWKMVLLGLLVMTSTFVGSATIAHFALKLTGGI